ELPIAPIRNYELSKNGNIIEYSRALRLVILLYKPIFGCVSNLCLPYTPKSHDVAKIKSSATSIILGPLIFTEMELFPQSIMNDMKPIYKLYPDHRTTATRLEAARFGKTINSVIMENIDKILQDKEILIDEILFLYMQSETPSSNETVVCYGDAVKNDKQLNLAVNDLILMPNTFSESNIRQLLKISMLRDMLRLKKSFDYLAGFIKKEILELAKKRPALSKNGILELVVRHKEFPNISVESTNLGFIIFILCSIKYIWPQISNVIVDISLHERVYKNLLLEQKNLIKKYGNVFTRKILDRMKYLDAVLLESMRLSGSGQSLRMLEKDVYLSNGIKLKKSSLVKFSNFIYNNDYKVHGPNSYAFWPERFLLASQKFTESSKTNIVWGIGWKKCPYCDYAALSLKLFISIFLRKYKIISDSSGPASQHQGYVFDESNFHSKSDLHVEISDILHAL
ncbi:hypothetical protein BB560_003348, partial [Smittium megazygosporum]